MNERMSCKNILLKPGYIEVQNSRQLINDYKWDLKKRTGLGTENQAG